MSDWSQWRGPERTGVVAWTGPEEWPERLERRWQVEVGEGHSSPVVVGNEVFQFSREEDDEVIRRVNLKDGTVVWEQSYPAPYRMNPAATAHGKGPKSTPLVAEGLVYTLGIDGVLSCWETEEGGLIWQHEFQNLFPATSPLYGHATSPILEAGKLIVHVGGPGEGSLLALEPKTGMAIWHHTGDGPGYTSPIIVDLDRTRQIVTQTDAHIMSVALSEGALLWQIPFTTPYDQNIVTPVLYRESLIFSGLEQRTFAVTLEDGKPRERWKSSITFYMSTPVLLGDRLIGFSDKRSGHFVSLNASSGKKIWEGPPRQGENAALVVAGEWILGLTDRAELLVLRADARQFEPVATYSVADSPTWAHPIPTSEGILVKDRTSLALWGV